MWYSSLICRGPMLLPPSPTGAGIMLLVSTHRMATSNLRTSGSRRSCSRLLVKRNLPKKWLSWAPRSEAAGTRTSPPRGVRNVCLGICSTWPGWRLVDPRLAWMRAITGTPNDWEMSQRVSPSCTTMALSPRRRMRASPCAPSPPAPAGALGCRCSASGARPSSGRSSSSGMRIMLPSWIVWFWRWLRLFNSSVLVLWRRLMDHRVSPGCTTV
mmetsp:Transcript_14057/g.27017  ORF Transcript_14057/g.27017 Transcript_14057/m.27017 type:complete len:213 (+) Transcript_14057:750-1388(+)